MLVKDFKIFYDSSMAWRLCGLYEDKDRY